MNDRAGAKAALKPAQFQNLLRKLDLDHDRAGEKYEELRRKLIKYFEWNCCFPAEDLVDVTLDRAAGKLETEDVRDLQAFAWGIAKNVRQEAWKRAGRVLRISDLTGSDNSLLERAHPENVVQEKISQEQRVKCLRRCMQLLPGWDSELFSQYYDMREDGAVSRLRLADDLGITLPTLRVRINRMRSKLEKCVRQCVTRRSPVR
jgi:DNA-directed RNA polymerase specialized sigma24 family protein